MSLTELRHRYVGGTVPDATWQELSVAGVRCEAVVAGDGPPVVLMHGGLDSCVQWAPILPMLTRGHRCHLPERPSNGASDAFDYSDLDGDFRDHAVRVVADMFDGLGLDRAALVGNSMGGLFSLAFAAARPERVERVVLVGVPAGHEDRPLPAPVRLMAHPVTRRLIALLSSRARDRDTRRIAGQLLMAHPERLPDELIEIGTATSRRNARAWRDFATRVVAGGHVRSDLRSGDWVEDLAVPVGYVVGDRDAFGSADHIRSVAARIGADVTVIPDAGHLPWLDEPALVAEAVVDHLAGRARRGPAPTQRSAG